VKVKAVRVTPIAFRDPPLLNASGIHEPWALRSIIEVEGSNGLVGLGESYGDAPVLRVLEAVSDSLAGLDAFDLNGLRSRVAAMVGALKPSAGGGADLAPGSQPGKQAANAYSAFEVAFLDLQARTFGVPLVDLLGGPARNEVPFSAYLFFKYAEHIDAPYAPDRWGEALSEEQIVAQAQRMIDEYGFGSIKLKAGALEPEHEAGVSCWRFDAPSRITPCGSIPTRTGRFETSVRLAHRLGETLQYYVGSHVPR